VDISFKKYDILGHLRGLLIGKVACEAAVAGDPLLQTPLLLLASHNNPAASAIATDSAVMLLLALAFLGPKLF
jgi:hypothetical protein